MPVAPTSKAVVIALGNASRGDDGAGPAVADLLKANPTVADLVREPRDAMGMVAAWQGMTMAVVVDAAQSGSAPGTVHRVEHADGIVPKDAGRTSSHGLGLAEALALGAALDRLPDRMVVYGIEAASFDPEAALTPDVAASVPVVAARVVADLETAENIERVATHA
jgi:hydrogenase maturation protease